MKMVERSLDMATKSYLKDLGGDMCNVTSFRAQAQQVQVAMDYIKLTEKFIVE